MYDYKKFSDVPEDQAKAAFKSWFTAKDSTIGELYRECTKIYWCTFPKDVRERHTDTDRSKFMDDYFKETSDETLGFELYQAHNFENIPKRKPKVVFLSWYRNSNSSIGRFFHECVDAYKKLPQGSDKGKFLSGRADNGNKASLFPLHPQIAYDTCLAKLDNIQWLK